MQDHCEDGKPAGVGLLLGEEGNIENVFHDNSPRSHE